MHEASIIEALAEQILRVMPEGGRLVLATVEVGELEHLDPGVMTALWEAVTAGSPLGGATLEIERVPVRVRCGACAVEFAPEDRAVLICPACGAVRPEILAGVGIVLRSLEVEEPGP